MVESSSKENFPLHFHNIWAFNSLVGCHKLCLGPGPLLCTWRYFCHISAKDRASSRGWSQRWCVVCMSVHASVAPDVSLTFRPPHNIWMPSLAMLVTRPQGWQPVGEPSTLRSLAMKFGADIHSSLLMTCHSFVEPLTFIWQHHQGQNFPSQMNAIQISHRCTNTGKC